MVPAPKPAESIVTSPSGEPGREMRIVPGPPNWVVPVHEATPVRALRVGTRLVSSVYSIEMAPPPPDRQPSPPFAEIEPCPLIRPVVIHTEPPAPPPWL